MAKSSLRATRSAFSLSSSKAERSGGAVLISGSEAQVLRGRAQAVLAEAGYPAEDTVLGAIATDLDGLARDAHLVQAKLIDTGRRLIRLQAAAGEGGYRALMLAGLIPLSEASASKLRKIAEAVDVGLLPLERLPRGAEAAYAVAKLPLLQIERLLQSDVLRPDATAKQIRDAVRPLETPMLAERPLTKAQRRALERKLARHEAEAAKIRARLAAG